MHLSVFRLLSLKTDIGALQQGKIMTLVSFSSLFLMSQFWGSACRVILPSTASIFELMFTKRNVHWALKDTFSHWCRRRCFPYLPPNTFRKTARACWQLKSASQSRFDTNLFISDKKDKRMKVLWVASASCSDYVEPVSLLCHGLMCFDACSGLLITQQCLKLKRAFNFNFILISFDMAVLNRQMNHCICQSCCVYICKNK